MTLAIHMPSLYLAKDGSKSVATNVLIPCKLKEEARRRRISLSRILTEALKKEFEDQGEKLAGDLAPGHHHGAETQGANQI